MQAEEAAERWAGLLANWSAVERSQPGVARLWLMREGAPDAFRGLLWMALARAGGELAHNPGVFSALLAGADAAERRAAVEAAIARDVKRTFSKHQFFADQCAQGHAELSMVLRAYAAYDVEVG